MLCGARAGVLCTGSHLLRPQVLQDPLPQGSSLPQAPLLQADLCSGVLRRPGLCRPGSHLLRPQVLQDPLPPPPLPQAPLLQASLLQAGPAAPQVLQDPLPPPPSLLQAEVLCAGLCRPEL